MFKKTRLIGFALTILFLGLALWRVDLQETGATLATANYAYVLPAAALTLAGYFWRTYRWHRLIGPTKEIATSSLFPILMIGFMANNVLPARIGEFVRAYVLGREQQVRKSMALATIILERMFDGLILVLFLGVLSLFVTLPGWSSEVGWLGAVVFLGAAVGMGCILLREQWALAIVDVLCLRLPDKYAGWVRDKAELFISGLGALRQFNGVAQIIALSVIVWLFEALSYFLIIKGFSLPLSTSTMAFAAVLMMVIVNLGIMIPSAPGYIGTFQFFGILALSVFGVRREVALSIAVVSHTMQYVMVTVIGLIFFWRHQLSLRELQAKTAEVSVD